MKRILILILLITSSLVAQFGRQQYFQKLGNDSLGLAYGFSKLKVDSMIYIQSGGLRYFNGQFQFSNNLVNWFSIPTSLPTGGGWTLGLNKIYQSTAGNPVHIRQNAGDTTGTALFNVYSNFYAKGNIYGNSFIPAVISEPAGGYQFDGVDDYISIANNPNLNFGTEHFSFLIHFKTGNIPTSEIDILNKRSGNIGYNLYKANGLNNLNFFIGDLNGFTTIPITSLVLTNNTEYFIVISINRDGNLLVYSKNQLVLTSTSHQIRSGSITNTGNLFLASYNQSNYFAPIKMYGFRLFNKVLTESEITQFWNNGRPDLSEVPYELRGANQTTLTSGTLLYGKRYRIDNYVTGDDFTNVGASSNATGVEFVATGTTPANWTNGSSLRQIGCVLDLKPTNAGSFGWYDASGNQLHGTTYGNPVCLTKDNPNDYVDLKLNITGATTLTNIVPKGYQLESIYFKNTTANAVTGGIKIGTTSGGSDVVTAEPVAGNSEGLMTLNKKFFSSTADQTLYVNAVTSWNGASINLIFRMRKVN